MGRALLVMLLAMLAGCGSPPSPEGLAIPVHGRCLSCEEFIRCDGGSVNAAVYDPTFDLYRLEPAGIGALLAASRDFLLQAFYKPTEESRPLTIYAQRPGQFNAFERTVTRDAKARTDLVAHRIQLPSGWINQVTGEWHASDGDIRGSCHILEPAAGRELARLFADPAPGDPS